MLSRIAGASSAAGCSGVIIWVSSGFVLLGLACFGFWQLTGNDQWIEQYFQIPVALLLVWLTAIQFGSSLLVVREFSPDQPMRKAWRLIAFSAGFDLTGNIFVQILGSPSTLNPVTWLGLPRESAETFREFGLVLGGSCRFAFLAAGLAWALKVYRRAGLLARLTLFDAVVLAVMGIYVALEAHQVIVTFGTGRHPPIAMVLGWPADPLLWILLGEALLLFRSAHEMGGGWLSRCWKAFGIGIFCVSLGDILSWAGNSGFLPWPWSSLQWFVWLPAASAFALAPVCQLEATHLAVSGSLPSGRPE